tara:strand:+ start:427 stop:633 length:207 start_codon:yes stop_codon:yes gene_type:complete
MAKSNNDLLKIYYSWKNKSKTEGFTHQQFWSAVNNYIDPMDSDAASYAIAGKLAYNSLLDERLIDNGF